MMDTTEEEIKFIALWLSLVFFSAICFGARYLYTYENTTSDHTDGLSNRPSQNQRYNRGKKKKKFTIRRSILAHPTTSDEGSPTLSFHDCLTESYRPPRDQEDRNIDVKKRKRVPKRTVVQETLCYNSVKESACVEACLSEYEKGEVELAVKYLIGKESFRYDAKHLSDTIQHLDILKKKERVTYYSEAEKKINRVTDYSEAELDELLDGDKCLQNIPTFKKMYGYPPTPEELLQFEPENLGKNLRTQKNARLVKKCRRLALREKELQSKINQCDVEVSVLKLKCNFLQKKKENLEIEVMRAKCKICKDNEIGVVVHPCDHAFCCVKCARVLYTKSHGKRQRETCAICNIKVISFKPFYLS